MRHRALEGIQRSRVEALVKLIGCLVASPSTTAHSEPMEVSRQLTPCAYCVRQTVVKEPHLLARQGALVADYGPERFSTHRQTPRNPA